MPALDLYLPRVGEEHLCAEEIEQEGERDEGYAGHPQRPSQPGSGVGAQPTDSSPLFPCPFCHDTTLQQYRLLNVTKAVTRKQGIEQFHLHQDAFSDFLVASWSTSNGVVPL